MKKITALLLLITFAFSLLTACASEEEAGNTNPNTNTNTSNSTQPTDTADEIIELFAPAPENAPIAPLARWSPNESNNSIIWGDYIIDSSSYTQILGISSVNEEGLNAFLGGMEFEIIATDNHDEDEVSVLPLSIQTGPKNVNHRFDDNLAKQGYRLIIYQVYSKIDEEAINLFKPYKVEGNRIIIYPEWTHEYIDADVHTDDYRGSYDAIVTVNTEKTIELEYYFDELNMVLSRNGVSVRMVPRDCVNEEPWVMLTHFANDRQGFNNMVYIEHFVLPLRHDGSRRLLDNQTRISFSEERFASIDNPIDPVIRLYGNGLMQISWEEIKREKVLLPSEPGSWTLVYDEESGIESNPTDLWFRYLWCGSDGIILIDENEQHYFYQVHSLDFDKSKLADSLGDDVEFEDLSEFVVRQLIEEHSNVLETLQTAFTDAGIEVNINTLTGRVTLDTSFLFGINEYELTSDGTAYLDGFLDVYADVILSDAFTRSIAEIIVEGHTCSDGSREMNQILSESRAAAVADYCLLRQPELAEIVISRGLAFDYPVLDADGNEDKPASRRVVFRFILST